MPTPVERVRLAMKAVAEATPGERQQRMVALYEAAVDLRDLVARYQLWLVAEDDWLAAHAGDPALLTREVRFIARLLVYQEACDTLAAAYAMVRDDASSIPAQPVSTPPVAELPRGLVGVQAPLGSGFAGPLGALGEPPF